MLTFAEARIRLEDFISQQPTMIGEASHIKAILDDMADRLDEIKAAALQSSED